ncbi:hypothetical protein HPB47_000414 [Ixodes persulcatus]|uniref:Uncharacterized protein n=1 Tax=Ixodes persulcatus TaxID=34615 RepID=A0AC60PTA5_IXOPE|nr:hypothetical protein HPB47_000414 [Ixodes persulcatus]
MQHPHPGAHGAGLVDGYAGALPMDLHVPPQGYHPYFRNTSLMDYGACDTTRRSSYIRNTATELWKREAAEEWGTCSRKRRREGDTSLFDRRRRFDNVVARTPLRGGVVSHASTSPLSRRGVACQFTAALDEERTVLALSLALVLVLGS